MQTSLWRLIFFGLGSVAIFSWSRLWAGEATVMHSDRVLATRQISKDQQLVVTEGPYVPFSAVRGLASAEVLAQRQDGKPIAGFTSISVELRFNAGPPLRLFSTARQLWDASEHNAYQVLDVSLTPGGPLVLIAGPDYDLVMLRVPLDGEVQAGQLRGWSHIEAASAPRTVKGRISFTADKKRATVDVWEIVDNQASRTDYVQRGNAWKFDRVKEPAR